MRLLCYSDLQATDGDELCFSDPTLTLQHYRVAKCFEDLARIAQECSCDALVDLGDTTDDRTAIQLTTVEVLGEGIAKLPDVDLFKITGNHEQYLRDTSISNRHLFDHRFAVVTNRKVWRMKGWTAFFVSYPADHKELTEWLIKEAANVRGPKVLFGHFQVIGAFYQSGKAFTGVPLEALEPFSVSLLGHIHSPQSLSKRVHYVGSPFQQDWGEAGQAKRVAVLDTTAMTVDWIPMTGYPEYREIGFDDFVNLKSAHAEDRYRVVLSNHEEAESFFRHPNFYRATAKYSYDETPQTSAEGEEQQDWSFDGTLRRYMKTVPPKRVGIDLTDEEMLLMVNHITG
jgi:DNA repair exonuclease SbcCD nuclease subunit